MIHKLVHFSANQSVDGWLERMWYPQPTMVPILVLAFIPEFISEFPAMHIQWDETFPSMTKMSTATP